MKKLLSIALLAGLSLHANATERHVITDLSHSESSLSFNHELLKYQLAIDKVYPFAFNIRTDALSINMKDLTYRREFDLNDVYKIPGVPAKIQRLINAYETTHDIKVNFEVSYVNGFRFTTEAKTQREADKAAQDIKNIIEKETQKVAKEYFHHISIGNNGFFDYAFAAHSQSNLGETIYRKTKPIVSRITNPLNQLQFYLDFVQRIPYDKGELSGNYFRTPLAVLMDNKGDCDEKALLLTVILKEAFPGKKVGILALENIPHAIAVIESERPMSKSFRYKGVNYVPLETTANLEYGDISTEVKNEIKKGKFYLFTI